MDSPVGLGPSTILGDRPFTHPGKSLEDLSLLKHITDQLRLTLSRSGATADPSSLFTELQQTNGRDCRIIIAKRERLMAQSDLCLVGFFGRKRADANPAPLDTVDEALIREFSQHPGVLSYCSQQLEDGNWGNMVVLDSVEAREHWRTSERHAYAARELAPGYYLTIRLHNAMLPGGLFSGQSLILQRTKYYDFQDQPPWYAIREF